MRLWALKVLGHDAQQVGYFKKTVELYKKMSSPEVITRGKYKERHGIAELPDSITARVESKRPVRNTPFHRVRFGKYSLIIPSTSLAREEIRRGDCLCGERMVLGERRSCMVVITVARKGRYVSHFHVDEQQIMPNDSFLREAWALFERDRQTEPQRWVTEDF